MPFSSIDWIIFVIIILSAVTGFFRGLVKECTALAIWVIGIWAGFHFFDRLTPYLTSYIHDKTARSIVAFALILLLVLILGAIVNVALGFLLHKSGLSSMDRILGMGFGIARGIFLISLAIVVLGFTSFSTESFKSQSLLYTKFDPVVKWIRTWLPDVMSKAKTLDKQTTHFDINPDF